MGKYSIRWSKDSTNRMKYKFGDYTEFSLHLFMYFQLFQLFLRSFRSSFEWMNHFLFEHAKIKSFTLLAEVGGLSPCQCGKKIWRPAREETRGPTTLGLAT